MQDFQEYVQKRFNLTKQGALRLTKMFENRDIDNIEEKIKQIIFTFRLSSRQLPLFVRRAPQILDMDLQSNAPGSIQYNLFMVRTRLGLKNSEFITVIQNEPAMALTLSSPQKTLEFEQRMEFLQTQLDATPFEIGKMLLRVYNLFTCAMSGNEHALKEKIDKLKEVGFSNRAIRTNSFLLNIASNKIKLRYIMQKIAEPKVFRYEHCQYPQGLLLDEKVVYARYMFMQEHLLQSRGRSANGYLFNAYYRFEENTGIKNSEILKRYPLTREKALKLVEQYNASAIYKLTVQENEIAHLPTESDSEGCQQ